jgi:lysophospholipase
MLLETADNPTPPDPRIIPLETQDGMKLHVVSWLPAGEARGTILLMQGRAEFIEKYFETIMALLARGFAVVAFDWRGQGRSGRSVSPASKGHIADFSLYRRDILAIDAQVLQPLMPKPVYGLAHSMGGCIALIGAREGWLPVSRLVTVAPMIELKMVKHPRLVRTLIRLLAFAGLSERFVPGGRDESIATLAFAGNRLSGDLTRYERNAALAARMGTAAIGAPTIGWLAAAYRAMDRFREPGFAAYITMPVLVVAAGDDPVCSTPAIEAFAAGLPTGPAIVLPDSRHEILMENDAIRAAFWRAFDPFVAPALPLQPLQDSLVQARIAAGND